MEMDQITLEQQQKRQEYFSRNMLRETGTDFDQALAEKLAAIETALDRTDLDGEF